MSDNIIHFPQKKKVIEEKENLYTDSYLIIGDIFDIFPKDIAVEGIYFIAYSRAMYPPPEDLDDGYDGVTLVSDEEGVDPSVLFSTHPYSKMEILVGDNNEDQMKNKVADASFFTDSGIIAVIPLSALKATHLFPDDKIQALLDNKAVVKIPKFTGVALPTAMGFCAGNLVIGPEKQEETTE